jgi:hypothetical protein
VFSCLNDKSIVLSSVRRPSGLCHHEEWLVTAQIQSGRHPKPALLNNRGLNDPGQRRRTSPTTPRGDDQPQEKSNERPKSSLRDTVGCGRTDRACFLGTLGVYLLSLSIPLIDKLAGLCW